MAAIHPIRLGSCTVYLIRGEAGCVLVDGGNRGRALRFARALRGLGLRPNAVRLIAATHVHYDHVGSLADIQALCGCPVAVHGLERERLATAESILPPGTNVFGRAVVGLGRRLPAEWLAFRPVWAEVIVDGERSLEDFGLSGRILPTPGHTAGSISVLLDDGRACIGDAAVNFLPWGLGPIFPPFAEDPIRIPDTWRALLDAGARAFYPAHGAPFSARRLERALRKRRPGRYGGS